MNGYGLLMIAVMMSYCIYRTSGMDISLPNRVAMSIGIMFYNVLLVTLLPRVYGHDTAMVIQNLINAVYTGLYATPLPESIFKRYIAYLQGKRQS